MTSKISEFYQENKKACVLGALGATAAVGYAIWALRRRRNADPNIWLEEVLGDKCLDWVKGRNASALQQCGDPVGSPMYDRILAICDSKDKIPYVSKIEQFYYNFWQDEKNTRGIWRRTALDEYKKKTPNWELVLDLVTISYQFFIYISCILFAFVFLFLFSCRFCSSLPYSLYYFLAE